MTDAPFRIVKQPRSWWPVEWTGLDEDGGTVRNRIELRFRIMKVDPAAKFIREVQAAQELERLPEVVLSQLYAELVGQIATDWRGVAAENGDPLRWDVPDDWATDLDADGRRKPLVAPNLALLMGEGGMFTHVFNAWRACLVAQPKVREGN